MNLVEVGDVVPVLGEGHVTVARVTEVVAAVEVSRFHVEQQLIVTCNFLIANFANDTSSLIRFKT
jgi:hypothetical protein